MIYVASSWRNPYYTEVVKRLREEGFDVYDFRNPPHGGNGFRWTDIDENAPNWSFEEYSEGLHHPKAERQFAADLIAYIPEMVEPELMYKLFDKVVGNLDDLVKCFWYDGEIKE